MSSERGRRDDPNRDPRKVARSDGEDSGLKWKGVTVNVTDTDCAQESVDGSPVEMGELGPAPPAPWQSHEFEFRLADSERQERFEVLTGLRGGVPIVALERVRAFVMGDRVARAPATAISGVEVRAEWQDGHLRCTAELSDFPRGEVVVVQVVAAVYGR